MTKSSVSRIRARKHRSKSETLDRGQHGSEREIKTSRRSQLSRRNAALSGDLPAAKKVDLCVRKIAAVEDEQTGRVQELFVFDKSCNRTGLIGVARDEAGDPRKVYPLLRMHGAILPKSEDAALAIIQKAIETEPHEYRLHVSRAGWQDHAYVARSRVISFAQTALRPYPPMWTSGMAFAESSQQGSLDAWKIHVARPVIDSSAMTTMLCASFAAPLLRLIGRHSFFLNVFGNSKEGKSTGLIVAGSAIGIGTEGDLPNWNTTDAGLLQLGRLFCDLILPINELGVMKGKKDERRNRIAEITYAFAEGRDRLRHSTSTYATGAASAKFYGILVATAERSLHAQSLASGGREEGEVARAHDVPAVPDGAHSIFDLDRSISPAEARLRLVALRKACEANHGMVMHDYVRYVAAIPKDTLREIVGGIIDGFVAPLKLPALDLPLAHTAENFATLLAGGLLAIESGVVPWNKKRLRRALVTSFEGFRKATQRGEDPVRKARRSLRQALKAQTFEFVKKPSTLTEVPPHGFRTKNDGKIIFVVPSKSFSEWFVGAEDARAALGWLHERKHLRTAANKMPTSESKGWAETTLKIAAGKKARVIQFRSPFSRKKRR